MRRCDYGAGDAGTNRYCADVPRPPNLHEPQIPKPLPLAWIKPHSDVIRASSAPLSVPGVNAVSVRASPPPRACSVVPQAAIPGARADAPDPAVAALQDPPAVASSFTTTEVG